MRVKKVPEFAPSCGARVAQRQFQLLEAQKQKQSRDSKSKESHHQDSQKQSQEAPEEESLFTFKSAVMYTKFVYFLDLFTSIILVKWFTCIYICILVNQLLCIQNLFTFDCKSAVMQTKFVYL